LKSELQEGEGSVRDYIVERINAIAAYILETGATVRACAVRFRVSKTTVHKDMRERLPRLNPHLAQEVSRVLDGNREERHLRGGAATRRKYRGEPPAPPL
jgi:putative DeoR family transcriptional regulator (stage III sporulation protein D)